MNKFRLSSVGLGGSLAFGSVADRGKTLSSNAVALEPMSGISEIPGMNKWNSSGLSGVNYAAKTPY